MKNPLIKNLNKIEFPVTYLCTGRCRHCSEADKTFKGHISGDKAAEVITKVSEIYGVEQVLLFGGEPLLFPEECYKMFHAAKKSSVKKLTVITNGWFSKDVDYNCSVAEKLVESGCNRVLISVDAFHQETIPLEPVVIFAQKLESLQKGIVKTNPAWIKGRGALNGFDSETSRILKRFSDIGISEASGNVVFPAGNALKYLSEFFEPNKRYINPYEEDPQDLRTLSVDPDGSVLGGNIYQEDISDILSRYKG